MKFNLNDLKNSGSTVEKVQGAKVSIVASRGLIGGIIAAGIMTVVALILLFTGGMQLKFKPVEATVTDIAIDAVNVTATYTLSYNVDGTDYTQDLVLANEEDSPYTVGSTMEVYYNPENCTTISANSSIIPFIIGIILALAAILVGLNSVISFKRWFKKLTLEGKARNLVGVTQDMIEKEQNNDSPLLECTFASDYDEKVNALMQDTDKKFGVVSGGWTRTLNLRTPEGEIVYDIHLPCSSITIIPVTVTSENRLSSVTVKEKARIPMFALIGAGTSGSAARHLDTTIGSPLFTGDYVFGGEFFWNKFFEAGYYYDYSFESLTRREYVIMRYGVEVARIACLSLSETANVDQKFIGNQVSAGQYRVTCHESDLDMVMKFCLILWNKLG